MVITSMVITYNNIESQAAVLQKLRIQTHTFTFKYSISNFRLADRSKDIACNLQIENLIFISVFQFI